MTNDFKIYIGIEMHVEVLTQRKAFSNSLVTFKKKVNSEVNEYDIGLPGAKPILNKEFIDKSIIAAKFFGMNIADKLIFDRKHYFYTDLPKGFQITQNYNPLGFDGSLVLDSGKKVTVKRLHLEEDTAKQTHKDGLTLIDYNRAGNPLIEIVADHQNINSVEDVREYVEKVRNNLIYLGITNGKMEEGSMRIDANISVEKLSTKQASPKIEIKNVNSINNLLNALEIEEEDLIYSLNTNKDIKQSTKRFDDKKRINVLMRSKETKEDYRYITETNILPWKVTKEYIDTVLSNKNKSYDEVTQNIKDRYKDIDSKLLATLTNNKDIGYFVDNIISKLDNPKKGLIFVSNNVFSLINSNAISLDNLTNNKDELVKFLNAIAKGKIDSSAANKNILDLLLSKTTTDEVIKNSKKNSFDSKELEKIVDDLITKNKDMISKEYKSRPERIEKMIMGQVMKETKGGASPQETIKLIKTKLK